MSELAETGRVKGLVRVWLLEWISMSYRSFYLIWRLLRSGVTLHLRETGVQEWFGSGEQAGGEEVAEATMHGALASKTGGWVRVSASLLFTDPEGRDADSKPQERLTLWPETKQQGSNCMLHVQNIFSKQLTVITVHSSLWWHRRATWEHAKCPLPRRGAFVRSSMAKDDVLWHISTVSACRWAMKSGAGRPRIMADGVSAVARCWHFSRGSRGLGFVWVFRY